MAGEYTLIEMAYLRYLKAKYNAIKFLDSVRPHIFLRKDLTEYQPREFLGMEIGEVLDMLNMRKSLVTITY